MMETLKDYNDYLLEHGYELAEGSHEFINGFLRIVTYKKKDFKHYVRLYVEEIDKFCEFLKTLKEGDKYEIENENYIVKGAHISSPICNIAGYCDNDKSGISLVRNAKPEDYIHHDLSFFEECLGLQDLDLSKHELKIMKAHIRNLEWVNEILLPILRRCDYTIYNSTIFDISDNCWRDSSDFTLTYKHINGSQFFILTDCLTGELKCSGGIRPYGKSSEETEKLMREKIWSTEKGKLKPEFAYLYSTDPNENKHSYYTLINLWMSLDKENWDNSEINPENIPERFRQDYENYRNRISREIKR